MSRIIEAEEQAKPDAPVAPGGYRKLTIEDLWVYRPQIYTCFYQKVRDPERAEDLTQDTFLRAWRYLDSFQPGPGSSLFSWLYRIAVRRGIDAWRHEQLHPQVSLEDTFHESYPPGVEASGEGDTLEGDDVLLVQVRRTLATMPPPYRQILIWMADDYKSAQIAQMLGVEVAVVYKDQRAARTMFKRHYARVCRKEQEQERNAA